MERLFKLAPPGLIDHEVEEAPADLRLRLEAQPAMFPRHSFTTIVEMGQAQPAIQGIEACVQRIDDAADKIPFHKKRILQLLPPADVALKSHPPDEVTLSVVHR